MRRLAHLTPRYLLDRLVVAAYERRHPDHPWLTADAIAFLAEWLKHTDHGLEFGSGRSTLWFARRVGHLISVEHDRRWHGRVEGLLKENAITNVAYHLRPASRWQEQAAIEAIIPVFDLVPDYSQDFVLVDGIVRDLCAWHALPKLKSGGLLIVDNANWFLPSRSRSPNSRGAGEPAASETWQQVWDALRLWRRYWTSNGITDTALFVKPD